MKRVKIVSFFSEYTQKGLSQFLVLLGYNIRIPKMILFLFQSNWIIMQQVPVPNIIMSMKSPRRYQLWKMAYSAISYDQAVLSARNLNILRWVFSAQKPTLIVMVCNVLLLYVYGEVEKFLLLRKHMGAKGSSTFWADRGIWKSRTRPGTC